jgi:hypothetical protein
VTGAKFCDFAAYDPRLPEHLQLLIIRIERDDTRIAEIEAEISMFLGELDDKVNKLNEVKL